MSKTKEELNVIKKELSDLENKLKDLSNDELQEVTGGESWPRPIILKPFNPSGTLDANSVSSEEGLTPGQNQSNRRC